MKDRVSAGSWEGTVAGPRLRLASKTIAFALQASSIPCIGSLPRPPTDGICCWTSRRRTTMRPISRGTTQPTAGRLWRRRFKVTTNHWATSEGRQEVEKLESDNYRSQIHYLCHLLKIRSYNLVHVLTACFQWYCDCICNEPELLTQTTKLQFFVGGHYPTFAIKIPSASWKQQAEDLWAIDYCANRAFVFLPKPFHILWRRDLICRSVGRNLWPSSMWTLDEQHHVRSFFKSANVTRCCKYMSEKTGRQTLLWSQEKVALIDFVTAPNSQRLAEFHVDLWACKS